MIEFHYWPTPNGWKVSIMLEECGLPYRMVPVNIGKGDQFKPEFLGISPNNRMPAIVDDGMPVLNWARSCCTSRRRLVASCRPIALVGKRHWSGCSGRWAISVRWPDNSVTSSITPRASTAIRISAMPMSTTAALGCWSEGLRSGSNPMRLLDCRYGVVSLGLISKPLGQALDDFPNVARWREAIKQRPAVQRGIDLGKELRRRAPPSEEERKILFNQTAQSIRTN